MDLFWQRIFETIFLFVNEYYMEISMDPFGKECLKLFRIRVCI